MSPVLVTGGSGYLGTRLITALLRDGCSVRTTVRSLESEADVRAAVRRGDADDSGLEVVVAGLTTAEGWPEAAADCDEVHHVATPMIHSDVLDEILIRQRHGALGVAEVMNFPGVIAGDSEMLARVAAAAVPKPAAAGV